MVFWEAYRGCAEENSVRPDRSPYYVIWAKDFANFLPEKPLKDRSRKDIEAFLADLGKRRGIADWQVQKAVKEAAARAAINKKVSCHTLRHFWHGLPSSVGNKLKLSSFLQTCQVAKRKEGPDPAGGNKPF